MANVVEPQSGCTYLGIVSVFASLLGSALAAPIYLASTQIGISDGITETFFALALFVFGKVIAIPFGLVLGIPLLALSGRYLPRHVVIATFIFALVGLLGVVSIDWVDDNSGGFAALGGLYFGGCVGGMHALLYSRMHGATWTRLAVAVLFSGAFVPLVAYAAEDVKNLLDSRAEFEERCADRYGSMAVVRDRSEIKAIRESIAWHRNERWRSLYATEDMALLGNSQILIARDYAYVPSGFAGWITGGRRVERHCLSESKGPSAEMLHRLGYGKRPTLRDLVD